MFALHFHPIQHIEERILGSFPQIERIISVFSDWDKEVYLSEFGEKSKLSSTLLFEIQSYRNKTNPYTWIQAENLSIFRNEQISGQLTLNDENKHTILVLLLPSLISNSKDILFLQFPKNSKFFGIQKEISAFTTDEKIIVAELLHKLFSYDLQTIQRYQKQATLAQKYKQLSQHEQENLQQSNLTFQTFFNDLADEYLHELSNELKTSISIDQTALSTLSNYAKNLTSLRIFLKDAAELASFLNPHLEAIILNATHISAVANNTTKQDNSYKNIESKVIELLDKYEIAATRANQSGFGVSGKTVAQFCSPPISPPAVSDSLKKYSTKIQHLLKSNPKQWILIRKNLKPLRDLNSDTSFNDSIAV